jgi:ubiquinol-cytochrome c reductase cytochrome b subunit|uniref:apocytochrome b n=1 Tax=Ancyromonas sigmoides TaxID=85707 RepID=UPI0028D72735|nr:apocytochrome b [Ancyromonas sigmoides]WMQ52549.1 apocytochrome b [Ancyromonas sigmoides]
MRLNHYSAFSMVNQMLVIYKAPTNLNYFWNFGVLAGLALVIQLITGISLAMHYTPHIELAFNSVDHIMRDLQYGWLLRYMHSNGASLFFMVVYAHIFRGLYYGSYVYPRQGVWWIGCTIYVLMMAVAFLGYVLPWGQMSFWGATVITNFFSIIPFFGKDVVEWIWGGFAVNNATLNRFYSLHYFLSFVIVGLSALHLIVLHQHGANNPLGVESKDTIPFYPYYYVKDLVGVNVYLIVYFFFVFFYPEALGHPDNYVPANPMVTPPSIVPEWYFLPMYAILRSIPYKTPGVLTMGLAVGALYLLPLVSKPIVRSGDNRPIFAILFWTFVVDCFLLGWVGSNHVETPWVECGQIATVYYFLFFFVLLPFATQVDNYYFSLSYRNEKLASKYITRLNVHTGECVGYGLARVGDDDSK